MKKSPYKDKKGTPIFEGNRIIGSTNFDKVQATVLFDANKKNDYESWLIQIDKHLENDKWIDHFNYTLHLAYHIDEDNNCLCYEIIN
jgi:hypothetical protein